MQLDKLPVIVGVPGVGKTTTNREISEQTGLNIVVTDEEFRRLRAIPANSNDPDAAMMRIFLQEARANFPHHPRLDEIVAAAQADIADPQGRAKLRDSTYFRGFGEDVFRTFEWAMNRYLHFHGKFENAVVDISSSAALYEQNWQLFNPRTGFHVFLLDAPTELIASWLLKDFRRHQALSAEAGEPKPVRGAYEAFAKKAIAQYGDTDKTVLGAMTQLSLQHRSERMEKFEGMAQSTIAVEPGQTQAETAARIVSALRLG